MNSQTPPDRLKTGHDRCPKCGLHVRFKSRESFDLVYREQLNEHGDLIEGLVEIPTQLEVRYSCPRCGTFTEVY